MCVLIKFMVVKSIGFGARPLRFNYCFHPLLNLGNFI